jgi:hypothetical protein
MQHLHISYFLWYQFPTVHHNMILIGYNKTCLLRHKRKAHKYGMKVFCVWKNMATCTNLKYTWHTPCTCGTDYKIHRGQQTYVCVCGIQVPGLLVIYRHPLPQVVCTIMPNRKMRKHISKKLRMHHTCSKIGRETVYEKTSSRP